jgi:hypothetical protein
VRAQDDLADALLAAQNVLVERGGFDGVLVLVLDTPSEVTSVASPPDVRAGWLACSNALAAYEVAHAERAGLN